MAVYNSATFKPRSTSASLMIKLAKALTYIVLAFPALILAAVIYSGRNTYEPGNVTLNSPPYKVDAEIRKIMGENYPQLLLENLPAGR